MIDEPRLRHRLRKLQQRRPFVGSLPDVIGRKSRALHDRFANQVSFFDDDALVFFLFIDAVFS